MFINYGNNSRLDALGFAPFGEVVNGLEVGNTRFANLQEIGNSIISTVGALVFVTV